MTLYSKTTSTLGEAKATIKHRSGFHTTLIKFLEPSYLTDEAKGPRRWFLRAA